MAWTSCPSSATQRRSANAAVEAVQLRQQAAPFDEIVYQAIELREDLAIADEAPGAIFRQRFLSALNHPTWVHFVIWEARDYPRTRRIARQDLREVGLRNQRNPITGLSPLRKTSRPVLYPARHYGQAESRRLSADDFESDRDLGIAPWGLDVAQITKVIS